jgi:hypothetical protein
VIVPVAVRFSRATYAEVMGSKPSHFIHVHDLRVRYLYGELAHLADCAYTAQTVNTERIGKYPENNA